MKKTKANANSNEGEGKKDEKFLQFFKRHKGAQEDTIFDESQALNSRGTQEHE